MEVNKRPYIGSLGFCILALVLFLILTNPSKAPVQLLIIPVVLLFFIAFCTSQLVLVTFNLISNQLRKRRIVAVVSASFITLIMILQSTGGISGADIALLSLILIVSAVYIEKF